MIIVVASKLLDAPYTLLNVLLVNIFWYFLLIGALASILCQIIKAIFVLSEIKVLEGRFNFS